MTMPKKPITPWTFVIDSPLRILIVDDDPILREFASVHLGTPFTTIETASNGAEAKAKLAQTVYDVALLDIEMPKLDGFSLLEEIRSDESLKQLRVIMLTGHDDIASIDRAYQLGADSFVTKPVNWRQLSYQIRYVMRNGPADSQPAVSHNVRSLSDDETGDVHAMLQSIVNRTDEVERQLLSSGTLSASQELQDLRRLARTVATSLAAQASEGRRTRDGATPSSNSKAVDAAA